MVFILVGYQYVSQLQKIKVFIPNVNFLYQLNKKQNSTDLEFFDYKSTFNKFSSKNKKIYQNGKKIT